MRALLRDFRTFAFSGNLIDLAVGLAIGTAFGAVVASLVENVILPLVAAIFGKPNFDDSEPEDRQRGHPLRAVPHGAARPSCCSHWS
jgi:large conductance mechanosensitive channel protein